MSTWAQCRISLTPMKPRMIDSPGREVDQPVQQPLDQEEQGPQAEQREGVGGEDDERLLGHAEHRGDGVEGEQQVDAALIAISTRKSGVDHPARLFEAGEQLAVDEAVGDRQQSSGALLTTTLSSMSGSSSRCRNSWIAVKISSKPNSRNTTENSDSRVAPR